MTVPSRSTDTVDPTALRVLITGYGPFAGFPINPSWLAVKPLHNTITQTLGDTPRDIHITSLEIATSYETVLTATPSFHARPPVVSQPKDTAFAVLPPPSDGYDLVIHVGVAGRSGHIRMEQLGRKYGYDKEDAFGQYAPVVVTEGDKPVRGFGTDYKEFPEELYTHVNCTKLVDHLQGTGFKYVVPSLNAGLYLCEFINYCSLAESKRTAARGEKYSKVLFIHVPPVGAPYTTEEVTEILRSTISWICSQ
ncbi:uncharacterized protein FIBRA_02428 [Fibroporia radiculosa]|uniref:Pyroglutamyl-peptidase I n=1 Tax=Fibroporia radiculosa TaxID=599839 RepID=J4G1P2_9APHY|nr:uncharacterized protein FIBRA_02428 [Fibroporia radiculosa]CCM00398.1 predicted protein [Fibroporia radiculosa]